MPLHVSSTCAHRQEVKIELHSLWYHHTYRCDDKLNYIASGITYRCDDKLNYTASGIITPIGVGVMIPEAVKFNFDLITMSTCGRNM